MSHRTVFTSYVASHTTLRALAISALGVALAACNGSTPPPAAPSPPPPAPVVAPPPSPPPAPSAAPAAVAPAPVVPIDAALVEQATGVKPEVHGDVVKVAFPRTDVSVVVDGAKLDPFQGLTSWAAFTPAKKKDVAAMVMGDLVLFEDEVNPVMSAALDHGYAVTALHNHFFYAKPAVYFMHIDGEGGTEELAQGLRGMLDVVKTIRTKTPHPRDTSGATPVTGASKIDAAKLDGVFGVKGTAKNGMYKAVFGREATASCGCTVGKGLGVATWAVFRGADERAVVDGDFAVTEGELQDVLKTLRAGGIDIVAIHHHMVGEHPRILFLHYWGHGPAEALARTLKGALQQTAWEGRRGSTT